MCSPKMSSGYTDANAWSAAIQVPTTMPTSQPNSSAPTFTNSDATLATADSCSGVESGRTYSVQMLRVNRLAAAIDITAAGTSAPMAIAANAKPSNQLGKYF